MAATYVFWFLRLLGQTDFLVNVRDDLLDLVFDILLFDLVSGCLGFLIEENFNLKSSFVGGML